MPVKNIKSLLAQATSFPAAIEAKLPAGAPKISTMLVDATGRIPTVPDFPMEIPDLPAPPALPAMPAFPGGAGLMRYVTGVEVRPVGGASPLSGGQSSWVLTPEEARGVVGQGHTVRDYA